MTNSNNGEKNTIYMYLYATSCCALEKLTYGTIQLVNQQSWELKKAKKNSFQNGILFIDAEMDFKW